jgi:hypothetical protein
LTSVWMYSECNSCHFSDRCRQTDS